MEVSYFAMAVVLLGFFVLGTAGFGSALIMVPLLAWDWPIAFVVPLVLLIDVPAAVLHTGLNFRQVLWRELPALLPSVIVGALAGIALIQCTVGDGLMLVLGLYVIYIGWQGLKGAATAIRFAAVSSHPYGFAMGLVETLFGTAGPVVMSWLSQRVSDPFVIRATMPMTIIGLSSIALGMVGVAGGLEQFGALAKFCSFVAICAGGCLAGTSVCQTNVWGCSQTLHFWIFVPQRLCLVCQGFARLVFNVNT